MVTKADINKDGKLDRWELYEFCVYNYVDKETAWNLDLIFCSNLYFQIFKLRTEHNWNRQVICKKLRVKLLGLKLDKKLYSNLKNFLLLGGIYVRFFLLYFI